MIDITKCLGCRKGIDIWTDQDGTIEHFDFFATADSASVYKCETPDIENFIEKNKNGMLIAKPEYKKFFEKQSFWWEDILDLAYQVFNDDPTAVKDFFNSGTVDERVHSLSNETIELTLLNMAEAAGLEINEEDYPDLIKFRK
jgi:hypothetical protein